MFTFAGCFGYNDQIGVHAFLFGVFYAIVPFSQRKISDNEHGVLPIFLAGALCCSAK